MAEHAHAELKLYGQILASLLKHCLFPDCVAYKSTLKKIFSRLLSYNVYILKLLFPDKHSTYLSIHLSYTERRAMHRITLLLTSTLTAMSGSCAKCCEPQKDCRCGKCASCDHDLVSENKQLMTIFKKRRLFCRFVIVCSG